MPEEKAKRGKEPPPDFKMWLAEALCSLNEFEEHESAEFCKQLINRGPAGDHHSVWVGENLSWLNEVGIISYREIIRNGHRLLLKRACSDFKTRKLLTGKGDPPGGTPAPVVEEPEEKPKAKAKSKKKATKKAAERKTKPKAKAKPEPKPVKKKRTCCEDPHVVRSRKTGKRRCKNCGKKYKSKSKEE